MGIRFYCPHGHKLNVKEFQAGRKGICPYCGARIQIPTKSTRPPSKKRKKRGAKRREGMTAGAPGGGTGGDAPGLAFDTAPATTVELPESVPAMSGAADAPAVELPGQWPAVEGPVVLPSLRPSPQPSPEVPLHKPLPAPAGAARASSPIPAPAQATHTPTPIQPTPTPAPAERTPTPAPAAADPIAEAPDAVWYVRPASGGQFGPASGEVMRSWLGQGRVGADSLVWREGWPDWRQASKAFSQLGAGQPVPPLGEIAAAKAPTPRADAARSRRTRFRQQSKRTQTLVIVLLIFALLILSGVLVWVLSG